MAPPKKMSSPDALHAAVGSFGRWQAGISFLMALLKLPIAWFQLSIIILEFPVDFWCARPTEGALANISVAEWRNMSQPRLPNGQPDGCKMYDLNGSSAEDPRVISCQSWEYSREIFKENIVTEPVLVSLDDVTTAVSGFSDRKKRDLVLRWDQGNRVTEWDLVCSSSILTDVAQATFMMGVLLGNILFGMAADRMGRKVPLIIAIGLQTAAGMISAFSPWFTTFLIARFILALATGGTMIISFVLVMEVVGDKWRTTIAIMYQIPFALGMCMMAGVSYVQRDWRDFHFTLSAVSAIFLSYWWLIPESPRWLLTVGREATALKILESAARWNHRDTTHLKEALARAKQRNNPQAAEKRATMADLMRTPNLRRNSIVLFVSWFLAGLSFFGFSQILGKVGSNVFVTTVLAGVIGVPGTVLCIYVARFGRKRTVFISNLVSGVACLLLIAVPQGMYPGDWPRLLLSATVLTGMSVTFPAIYVFSGELFPTVVRNVGMGSASMFSRFGSIIAPFVKSLYVYHHSLPLVVFGCACIIGSGLVILLPETRNCRLPDTLEDAEKFGKKRSLEKENTIYIPVSTT